MYEKHKWLLKKEEKMLKARDAPLNKATLDEAKKLREQAYKAIDDSKAKLRAQLELDY